MSPAGSVLYLIISWHLLLSGKPYVLVHAAVEGAAHRLAVPECQTVLDDFRDSQGHAPSAALASSKMSHVEFLSSLYFADGDGTPQCHLAHAPVAYTSPGRHTILVCSAPFASLFKAGPRDAQVVVIHEMLHALGLAENPPTSAAITAQVMRRCGSR